MPRHTVVWLVAIATTIVYTIVYYTIVYVKHSQKHCFFIGLSLIHLFEQTSLLVNQCDLKSHKIDLLHMCI